MIFPIRPAAAARAVLAAVVLVSAGGCTTLGTAPAKAGGPGAQAPPANPANAAAASTMSSQATDPAKPDGGGARRGDTRLVDTPPVEVVPPQVQVRRLDLDRVRQGMQPVPQAFITDLPASLQKIERAGKRKRLFIKTMLPAVLRANAAIKADRDFVKAVIALDIPPGELPDKMRRKLRALAEAYEVDPNNLAALKRRVDIVPPALVLAQAAIETGWGTSRFAQQGNAIFGQHTSDPDDRGMVPKGLEDPSFRVRAFEIVTGAVEAYLRNLNTHPAYAELRRIRAEARARGDYPDGPEMAAGLADYSARGQDYVEDIRLTIRANDLQAFADARLRPSVDRLVDARSFGEP